MIWTSVAKNVVGTLIAEKNENVEEKDMHPHLLRNDMT
jgi:hypothetical protein